MHFPILVNGAIFTVYLPWECKIDAGIYGMFRWIHGERNLPLEPYDQIFVKNVQSCVDFF